jgi:hypothetical protein
LGFRIGQSSGEWDVAISLYPADWPFAIFKVLMGEHPKYGKQGVFECVVRREEKMAERDTEKMTEWLDIKLDTLSSDRH